MNRDEKEKNMRRELHQNHRQVHCNLSSQCFVVLQLPLARSLPLMSHSFSTAKVLCQFKIRIQDRTRYFELLTIQQQQKFIVRLKATNLYHSSFKTEAENRNEAKKFPCSEACFSEPHYLMFKHIQTCRRKKRLSK